MTRDRMFCGLAAAGGVVLAAAVLSRAGDIDPPPGPVAPTMRTLDEIYNAVTSPGPGGCGPGIPGEVRQDGVMTLMPAMPGTPFQILSVEQSSFVPVDPGGLPTGTARIGLLTVRKNIDASSPLLMQSLATNQLVQQATATLRDAQGGYYSFVMEDARIVSIDTSTQMLCGGGMVHTEEVTFAFEEITWSHDRAGVSYTHSP